MGAPRKVFRIEETPAARVAADGALASERRTGIMPAQVSSREQVSPRELVLQEQVLQELAALRAAFATSPQTSANAGVSGAATGFLTSKLTLIADRLAGGEDSDDGGEAEAGTAPMTRIANELLAVTNGTEQATQKILAAAEAIDQLANNLAAALKGKIEQDLAQDIQDLVIRIFEACNFQDLIGQRVNKVMMTLKFVEDHITSVLDEIKNMSTRPSAEAAQYLHGPRLDEDDGHASQTDIDAIFDT